MANIGGAQAQINMLEKELAKLQELAFYDAQLIDLMKTNRELEHEKVVEYRRALDNIKIRAYELGCKELHDMALEALQ